MSGALAERVFAKKVRKAGFTDQAVVARRPFSVDEAERYPMFTPDLIELMRELLPPETHDDLATVVTLVARRPDHDRTHDHDDHEPDDGSAR